MAKLLVFGAGYSGLAIARRATAEGIRTAVTSRGAVAQAGPGIEVVAFDAADRALRDADFVVATAAPDAAGDPVLARWATQISDCGAQWFGYLSTTGVYGDRDGAWVDEDTPPAPGQPRSQLRLTAEKQWVAAAGGRPLDLIRLAGIYGPGRSALDDVRSGQARRVIKPGHAFGRIHRDDIAAGVLAAVHHPPGGTRVLNFVDDQPAESAAVIGHAAQLLGLPAPPAVPFETAVNGMSAMGRSFWAENRKVSNVMTKAALGIAWRYPSYREGLEAILAEERGQGR